MHTTARPVRVANSAFGSEKAGQGPRWSSRDQRARGLLADGAAGPNMFNSAWARYLLQSCDREGV